MLTHMKTTVEIPDSLFAQARRYARRQKLTLRALIELGLRHVIEEQKGAAAFRLRRASYKGRGLTAEMQGAGWEKIRGAAYEGRGS